MFLFFVRNKKFDAKSFDKTEHEMEELNKRRIQYLAKWKQMDNRIQDVTQKIEKKKKKEVSQWIHAEKRNCSIVEPMH